MATITIEYNGKSVEKELLCPGVVKSGSAYLVQCCVTKQWCYTNEARLEKLTAKYGSIEALGESYVSREGKRADSSEPQSTKSVATPTQAVKLTQEHKEQPKVKQSAHERWVEQHVKFMAERHRRKREQAAEIKRKLKENS